MRFVLLAVVTGLAAAAGLLGAGVYPADSTGTPPAEIEQERLESEGCIGPARPLRTAAAHGNGNRARHEYLNENVIEGATTTICAEDAAMYAALEPAIKVWNAALPNIASGAVLTLHPNTVTFQEQDPISGHVWKRTVTTCRGMDVEVLWLTDQTQDSQCNPSGWRARACYDADFDQNPLPRAHFLSDDNADADSVDQNYGIIYYQETTIS